ncbi:uncharacterized protein LOC124448444 [Xenia sp. Carnegie-2017]|uniref:uncharacterized protein LOC124448444 n=1 Tax=Xenia sp. Carnegie-2017 TaxID=2897299 RepID=UPI001F03889D|nr:uncharacterized protein LOC124448444 [Xenia sp. Carnegie-2017]
MASNNPPISDVKLGELPAYFKKFKLNSIPRGFMGMVSRYQQKYLLCKMGKSPFPSRYWFSNVSQLLHRVQTFEAYQYDEKVSLMKEKNCSWFGNFCCPEC